VHCGVASVRAVRWDRLFADLEAQLEADERIGFDADVADLVRAERAALALADRLRAHQGAELTWWLRGQEALRGVLHDVGADWVLVRDAPSDVVLPLRSVVCITGLSRAASAERGVAARLGLGMVLRGLARDRSAVTIHLEPAGAITGTIDRVGADHLDLAVHALDEVRRPAAVNAVRCVPFAAVSRVVV